VKQASGWTLAFSAMGLILETPQTVGPPLSTSAQSAMAAPWLWQRWGLEIAHREMKSGFGIGEKPCWRLVSIIASAQWSV